VKKMTTAAILGRCNKSQASYYTSQENKSKHAAIARHKEETMVKERIGNLAWLGICRYARVTSSLLVFEGCEKATVFYLKDPKLRNTSRR
jgi:hypothetical protein